MIDQTRCLSGAGFSALCYKDGEIQKRSFPNSFGGQFQLKGYELVDELRLLENAPRIAEEAVALHAADQCPEGEFDLILDSAQLGLQIHESIGHPIELDRVLGSEANYAGMSFLTLDQLNHLRYGSEIVNVVCDAREQHGPGLGTFAFDDEGVPAQGNDIIRNGQFVGYMTSRETAAAVGAARSNGCMRADGWARLPLIRMTNVSLQPGEQTLEEVFDVDHGSLHGDQSELVDRRQAVQLSVRLRDRVGDPPWQARTHAEESELQRDFDRVLECVRGHRGPRALDALGRSQLRQGTARAGDGHGPRCESRALPQDQGRQRVCRMICSSR